MKSDIIIHQAKFKPGDKIRHQFLNYRGIVLDIDPRFQHTQEWYDKLPTVKPPKDSPWYHILVHGTSVVTYVAEQSLHADSSEAEIEHPAVNVCFDLDSHGHYQRRGFVQ